MSFHRTLLFSLVISAAALGCRKRDQGSNTSPPRTMEGPGTGAEPYGDGGTGSPYDTGTPETYPGPSGTTTEPPGTTDAGNTDAGSPGYNGAPGSTGMTNDGGIGGYRDGGIGGGGTGDAGISDGGTGDGGTRPRRGRARDAGS
jgi:hypothetical protein